MAHESLATAQENPLGDGAPYETLVTQYRTLLEGSALNDLDKQRCRNWLKTKPTAEELRVSIEHFLESEESQVLVYQYEEKLNKKIEQGLFATKSKKAYLDWFKSLPLFEKRRCCDSSTLDDPRREKFLEMYEHLPTIERQRIKDKFFGGDFEERERLIIPLFQEHQRLKESFLRLPEEIQKKYRDQFKGSTLQDRRQFLQAIAALYPEISREISSETASEKALMEAFEKETLRLVRENLLSPASKIAHDLWYENLPLHQKRHMLKNSEIHTCLRDRINTRDTFYALPESLRKPHELSFRNSDLDRRKEILNGLQEKTGEKSPQGEEKQAYPEILIQRILSESLEDSSLTPRRIIFTEISRAQELRKRTELARDAKKTRDIARKTKEMGAKVDEAQIIDLQKLRHHGEDRHRLKKWLSTKQRPHALATNMTLLNMKKEAVTADQFKALILHPQQEELLSALVELASRRLPGVDKNQLRRLGARMDLTLDLLKVAA